MSKYVPIIGLEIHVELKTKSKMFCGCPNDPDKAAPARNATHSVAGGPNTNICEICLAHPGTLPVPNQTAMAWTVKIARALGCKINTQSKFDRKHYFYPDLPKGYQISQYDQPIGEKGFLDLELVNVKNHRDQAKIGITRVHLEEDTAKLSHVSPTLPPLPRGAAGGLPSSADNTLVDFNRAGVPLVEIVSDPNIESGAEAKAYCQELQAIFRYLGVSDADMEKGHMRCEANISVQTEDSFKITGHEVKAKKGHTLNPKVEVKNINSFRAVEKAIAYEIERQTKMLENGETWKQQTRGWDDPKAQTVLQREKETSADYRYFPEPDIPPFNPVKISGPMDLPELPAQKRRRFHQEYGFSYADADLLTNNLSWSNFAEEVMTELKSWVQEFPENKNLTAKKLETKKQELAKLAGGWLTSKLMGEMAKRAIDIRVLKLKPENFAELVALFYTDRVNSTNAQKILGEMLDSGVDMDPTHIMEEKGYGQVADEDQLGAVIDEVIKSYPKQVAAFKAGREPILQFLKGMVMKATEGSADPQVAEKLLRKKLK